MNAHPSVPSSLPSGSRSLSSRALLTLTEAVAVINSTLDLEAVLNAMAPLAAQVVHAEASSVLLLDRRRRKSVVVAAAGGRRDALISREFEADLGVPGIVLKSGQPVALIDASSQPRFCKQIDDIGHFPARSIIAAPLVHRGQTLGVVEVVNRLDGTDFSDDDLKLLQVFATLAAGAVQNARAYEELRQRFEGLQRSVVKPPVIIGDSPAVREMLNLAGRVAPSNATVLILGETGTGKELLARFVHQQSRRRHQTFAAINCAAFAETLLDSELFGHDKGAFTGAHVQRAGWFEVASGGTLFLDEIAELGRTVQAKLLRVLQEKEFVRVGGTQTQMADVRVVAATNRNLKNMMADGLLREDLYYRLNVFPIHMPALRERRTDIPLLVDHFVRSSLQEERQAEPPSVAAETLEMLCAYDWPGNIRELQNVIEWSVLMCEGQTLLPEHLPPHLQGLGGEQAGVLEPNSLYGQERAIILQAMQQQNWNQSRAARALGVSRDHLRHRLKKYGLHKPSGD